MDTAAIVFTVEELAALAQAAVTFEGLIAKIKAASPDAWASVQSDWVASAAAFGALPASDFKAPVLTAAIGGADEQAAGSHVQAVATVVPAVDEASPAIDDEVAAIVNAGGQLPGMPESLTNVSLDHPSTLATEPDAATQEVLPAQATESASELAAQLAAARALLAAHPGE